MLPTGYNPIRDAVSDYGVGPYRGWFWLQAVAGGVFERLFYLSSITWVLIVAIDLTRISG